MSLKETRALLTITQNNILDVLIAKSGLTYDDLAQELKIGKSTIVNAIQKLKRLKLIKVQKEQRFKSGRPKELVFFNFEVK